MLKSSWSNTLGLHSLFSFSLFILCCCCCACPLKKVFKMNECTQYTDWTSRAEQKKKLHGLLYTFDVNTCVSFGLQLDSTQLNSICLWYKERKKNQKPRRIMIIMNWYTAAKCKISPFSFLFYEIFYFFIYVLCLFSLQFSMMVDGVPLPSSYLASKDSYSRLFVWQLVCIVQTIYK